MKIRRYQRMRSYLFAVTVSILCLLALSPKNSFSMDRVPVPTVTVIDEETGKPIEGAVTIAIWRKHSITERAFWEGGTMVVEKIEEAVSDKDGNIFMNGFWGWHTIQRKNPHLTIYKPGYICWDQVDIYKDGKRIDFDNDHRIARLIKRPDVFSFNSHLGFVDDCTYRDHTKAPKQLFNKAFQSEISYRMAEDYKNDEVWRKEREEERKRYLEQKKGGEEQ